MLRTQVLAERIEPGAKQPRENDYAKARDFWRRAASVAPSDSERSSALAKAARITSERMKRHALAADLYDEAAAVQPESSTQAEYLRLEVDQLRAAKDRDRAKQVAQTVIREHPRPRFSGNSSRSKIVACTRTFPKRFDG